MADFFGEDFSGSSTPQSDFSAPSTPLEGFSFDSELPPSYQSGGDLDAFNAPVSGDQGFGSFGSDNNYGSQTSQPDELLSTSTGFSDFVNPTPQESEQPASHNFLEETHAPEPTSPTKPTAATETAQAPISQARLSFIQEFETAHGSMLESKLEEEKNKHNQIIEKAKKDLDEFYAERKKKAEKARNENRAKTTEAGAEAPASDKQAWKNLAELIEWNDGKKEPSSDTARMRAILLDMKHAS